MTKTVTAGAASFADLVIGTPGTYTLSAASPLFTATSDPFTVVVPAASGDGTMAVDVTTPVVAGSVMSPATFTFTAPADKSFVTGSATVLHVPTGWPAPTTAAGVGQVTVANDTSCGAAVSGVAATATGWDVTVTQTCPAGATFDLVYAAGTAGTKAGVATFTTKTKAGSAGTATALTSGSPQVTVTPAAASKLVYSTQPGGSPLTGGTPFPNQPVVALQDAYGNPVTDDTRTVTLAVTPGTGAAGAVLTCTQAANSVAAVAGVATFSGCWIDKAGTGYTLTASGDPALTTAASTPFTVTAVRPFDVTSAAAAGGPTQVTVSWDPPRTGGSPITRYDVQYSTSASMTSPVVINSATSGATTYTVTGLSNGITYYFQVRAANAINTAQNFGPSTPVSAAPYTLPSAVSALTATAGVSQVGLSWTAPNNGGGTITSYDVRYATNSAMTNPTEITGATTTAPTAGSPYLVTGLTGGTTYFFQARAVNAAGAGAWGPTTPVSALPYTTPSVLTALTAAPGSSRVGLSWAAPSNGGSAITRYDVRYATDSAMTSPTTVTGATTTAPTAGSPYSVTGLVPGTTYWFQVRAANAAGAADWGPVTPVSAVPFTTPATIESVTATPSSTQLTWSWSAPSDGGSPITTYDVQFSTSPTMTSPITDSTTSTTYTRTGLSNGTTYYFQVRARNVAGAAAWGPTTPLAATAQTLPSAVSALTATAGVSQVGLSWTAPNNGGGTITSYDVRYAT
ncbi:MAG: fibronectin type III domain-containing protein, partial [Actinomycetota bacterium]